MLDSSTTFFDLADNIQACYQQRFTGSVRVSCQGSEASDNEWYVLYLLGQIAWIQSRAQSKAQSRRRWQRLLAAYNPSFFSQVAQKGERPYASWNYDALSRLVRLGQFRRDRFYQIVKRCIAEDLFDMLQASAAQHGQTSRRSTCPLTCQVQSNEHLSPSLVMLQDGQAWQYAQREWQDWNQANLSEYSPNDVLSIIQLEALRTQVSAQSFQALIGHVNGANTLRDLSAKFRVPLIPFVKSILPYVSRQLLAFSSEARAAKTKPANVGSDEINLPTKVYRQAPGIAYIDDSLTDSRAMAEIVKDLGYRYTNIPNPIQALPALIESKPKLIFLDLVMPTANGYEVCAQIRRVSALKNTPVVIVTSNDGIADRVRAKIAGASGFIGKPIRSEKVKKVVKKHLSRGT